VELEILIRNDNEESQWGDYELLQYYDARSKKEMQPQRRLRIC
jgi:hypothetical protein